MCLAFIDFIKAFMGWINGNWESGMKRGKPEHLRCVTRR
jgi:hypothetical protein